MSTCTYALKVHQPYLHDKIGEHGGASSADKTVLQQHQQSTGKKTTFNLQPSITVSLQHQPNVHRTVSCRGLAAQRSHTANLRMLVWSDFSSTRTTSRLTERMSCCPSSMSSTLESNISVIRPCIRSFRTPMEASRARFSIENSWKWTHSDSACQRKMTFVCSADISCILTHKLFSANKSYLSLVIQYYCVQKLGLDFLEFSMLKQKLSSQTTSNAALTESMFPMMQL